MCVLAAYIMWCMGWVCREGRPAASGNNAANRIEYREERWIGLTRIFHKRSAARSENTMPAASQSKKESSEYFNMPADLFALFLEGLTSFAICIHGIFRPFATTFVKYTG